MPTGSPAPLRRCASGSREATYPPAERPRPLVPGPSTACADRLLGLAGGGVCPAGDVTAAAVRSYRTFSPLPWLPPAALLRVGERPLAVCFLWHCPWGCPRWPLATAVPCPARTFLPAPHEAKRSDRPAGPGIDRYNLFTISQLPFTICDSPTANKPTDYCTASGRIVPSDCTAGKRTVSPMPRRPVCGGRSSRKGNRGVARICKTERSPQRDSVIPAKAGIQTPWALEHPATWIPAPFGYCSEPALNDSRTGQGFAGMTKPGPGASEEAIRNGRHSSTHRPPPERQAGPFDLTAGGTDKLVCRCSSAARRSPLT